MGCWQSISDGGMSRAAIHRQIGSHRKPSQADVGSASVMFVLNPLKTSGNFNCRFKQCYSYKSTVNKSALIGINRNAPLEYIRA